MITAEPSAPAGPARAPAASSLRQVLARQLLETHLRERHQAMEADPSRLEGLDPEAGVLMIKAMGAAAHADGAIDALEQMRIDRALRQLTANETERARMAATLEEPPCLESLVRQVPDQETAIRFYAVSVRAVRRGAATNRAYLAYLANRLALPSDVVVRINRRFDVPLYVR